MSEQTTPTITVIEPELRRFRERVTASIALTIIVGTIILVIIAASAAFRSADDTVHERMKDLLLIVLPYAGVVLGYYFNKTSTEARAENAEHTARSAADAAQKATIDKQEAERFADKTVEERDLLENEVTQAKQVVKAYEEQAEVVDRMLQEAEAVVEPAAAAGAGTLSLGDEKEVDLKAWTKNVREQRMELFKVRGKGQALLEK